MSVNLGCLAGARALLCGSDNRVSLYDADTQKRQRVFVEKNHLSHSYTCFAWSAAGGGTGKRGTGDGGVDDLLAVGCSDGTIIVWNLVTGTVDRVLGVSNETPVSTDLAFSNDKGSLFVSSQSSVLQYSIKDGALMQTLKAGKRGALKLAMNPKANVLALASTSIKLVELSRGSKRKLDAQLAGGAAALCFSQCGQFLAAAAAGVREVLVFDIHADASSQPLFVHAVGGVPRELAMRSRSASAGPGGDDATDDSRLIDVLAIYQDSGGCLARISYAAAAGNGDMQPRVAEIDCAAPLLCGSFSKNSRLGAASPTGAANPKDCIRFAVGSYTSPYFGEVSFGLSGDGLVAALSLENERDAAGFEKSSGAAGSSAPSAGTTPAAILGPNDLGGKKRPSVDLEVPDSAANKKGKAAASAGGAPAGDAELTLEQRLATLSSSMDDLEQRYTPSAQPRSSGQVTAEGQSQAPTADSLVVLVDQALQTGDDALLEQCLGCDDEDVVDTTARRLPAARVVLLLRRLVSKFEKRPSRSQLLTRWLASILRHHTAFLFSVPDLSFQLPGLSQMLESRLGTYVPLAGLGGRLDLLMAQLSPGVGAGAGAGRGVAAAPNVYVEED